MKRGSNVYWGIGLFCSLLVIPWRQILTSSLKVWVFYQLRYASSVNEWTVAVYFVQDREYHQYERRYTVLFRMKSLIRQLVHFMNTAYHECFRFQKEADSLSYSCTPLLRRKPPFFLIYVFHAYFQELSTQIYVSHSYFVLCTGILQKASRI